VPAHLFQTRLDPDQYFAGLARQEMDFQDALGELIDNGFSARKTGEIGDALLPVTIEVTLEQGDDEGSVTVQVADHGVGISLDDITHRVFNPGGQGATRGDLNEHGFGLKNALALLTGGNSTDFEVITRSAVDNLGADTFLRIAGPLSLDMTADDDATRAQWEQDLHFVQKAVTGTKVRALVRWKYFRSVYKRGNPKLDFMAARLGEHLGVMHRHFIEEGNTIKLSYRKAGAEWIHHEVQAIKVPYEGGFTSLERELTVGGTPYKFVYDHGTLDYSAKDDAATQELGWPYPLRSYYQGSNARCGIDIVVRGRVIKSAVFEEIWPDIAKTVDFNRFVGELRVGADFRTTNNKTGLDPHADNWEELLQRLGDENGEFRPEKSTRSQSETSLRANLITVLHGTFSGAEVTKDRKVWGGGVAVDIFLKIADDNIRVYELKVTSGRVVDLYQLLAGWDGLVNDGVSPTLGVLVCKDYSQTLQDAVNAANARKDAKGDAYNIEVRRIAEVLP
jgi:hypothetical protein